MGSRRARWLGVVGLGLRRLRTRATRTAPRQVAFTVTGVAVPVALLLVVTSVSLGLAAGGTVASPDVDYWIVPESGGGSAVVPVEGPRFGRTHEAAARLADREDVADATPVLLELLRFEAGGTAEYVLAVGVVPGEAPLEVSGVSTAGLTPGDPHYAGGAYDGLRTDEVALSTGAAGLLGVSAGDDVRARTGAGGNRTLTVAGVSGAGPGGDLPVAVVHLAELQTLSGAAADDAADQLLVRTTDPSVRPALERVYPRSTVVARGGLGVGRVAVSALSEALVAAPLAVALVVGALSAATTMGLAVAAASAERAVLAAVGFSGRSRAVLLAVEALALSLLGGALGVTLWWLALPLANRVAGRVVADATVARHHPELVAYGLAAAAAIGLLVLPYLLLVGRRTTTVEGLAE